MSKVKYSIEYPFNSSAKILFNHLSTASGLSAWFADDVFVSNKTFIFIWEGIPQKAEMIKKKNLELVKFHWLEDENDEYFLEFKIQKDDITGETSLVITDFTEEGEQEESVELWDSQIGLLKHRLGI